MSAFAVAIGGKADMTNYSIPFEAAWRRFVACVETLPTDQACAAVANSARTSRRKDCAMKASKASVNYGHGHRDADCGRKFTPAM